MKVKYIGYGLLLLVVLSVISITTKMCSTATRVVNNGIETAYQQFKPEELLRKYEWFKDASAACEQKIATLHTYDSRFNMLKETYGVDSTKRNKWARDDREQFNIWQSEYLGIKASYNDLAATYNSQMAKFNYAFCNAGSMPMGSMEPLPREFKPYITN